jgi:hypothetical protein
MRLITLGSGTAELGVIGLIGLNNPPVNAINHSARLELVDAAVCPSLPSLPAAYDKLRHVPYTERRRGWILAWGTERWRLR